MFSDEKVHQLITQYQSETVLWCVSSPEYFKAGLRDAAIKRITASLGDQFTASAVNVPYHKQGVDILSTSPPFLRHRPQGSFGQRSPSHAMEPIRIYDKAGNCLSFYKERGLLLPMMPLETLTNVPNLDLRPDDVILVTYPKSGTHWFWEILSMLRNGRAETIQKPKQQAMLELMTQQDVDAFPEPRVFNTHFQYRLLPASVREKGNKIVLVHRNPKDVAVSFYNHHSTLKSLYGDYKGTFQDYLPIFTDGNVDWNSWFDYVLEWETVVESGPPNAILVLFYEDMQKEPLKETRRLAEFLEVEASDAFLQDVVKTCSFETMKKDKRPFSFDDYGHGVFYRKGTVGDWKNWFTVAQSQDFDRLFREKMAKSKLQFKFE